MQKNVFKEIKTLNETWQNSAEFLSGLRLVGLEGVANEQPRAFEAAKVSIGTPFCWESSC